MRIAVHGASVRAGGPRLAAALAGLALRGHDLRWVGVHEGAPANVPSVRAPRLLGDWRAEVVIGAHAPLAPATLAWRVGARALVLAIDVASLARWRLLDRWAWGSLYTVALLEESEAQAASAHARELPLERFALWSGEKPAPWPDAAHADAGLLERACERALARQLGRARREAVFVDRDGTLILEHGYLSDPAHVQLIPGAVTAIRALQAAGHPVIVISNQAGVGRGLYPLAQVYATMARLRQLVREQGAELDAIYFCPHAPDALCGCRKPGTLLLELAAEDQQLSLRGSVMIGDKRLDAATGQAAGGLGILVRTGYGKEEEERIPDQALARAPDHISPDLPAAAAWYLAEQEKHDG